MYSINAYKIKKTIKGELIMKHETGICYNCGADQGLHQSETMQCPRHGIEETRFDKLKGKFYPQQWDSTTFEDSGLLSKTNFCLRSPSLCPTLSIAQ